MSRGQVIGIDVLQGCKGEKGLAEFSCHSLSDDSGATTTGLIVSVDGHAGSGLPQLESLSLLL